MRYSLFFLLLLSSCASMKPPVNLRQPDSFVRVQYTVKCEYETDCLRQIQDMDNGVEGGTVTFTSEGVAKVDGEQRIRGKKIDVDTQTAEAFRTLKRLGECEKEHPELGGASECIAHVN